MFCPSKAIVIGGLPTVKVPRSLPSLARSFVAVLSGPFAVQIDDREFKQLPLESRPYAQYLQRDVIRAAALPSELHQSGAALRRGIAADCCFQLFFCYNAPKTVGAKQKIVAILQGQGLFGAIDSHVPSRS